MKFKGLKYISLFASFILMMFFTYSNVGAAFYQQSENKLTSYKFSRDDDLASVSIQYQNGIRDIEIFICNPSTADAKCKEDAITKFKDSETIINRENFNKTYTKEFVNPIDGTKRLGDYVDSSYTDGQVKNNYHVVMTASFCAVRSDNSQECKAWDEGVVIFSDDITIATGLTSSGELNRSIARILTFINDYMLPVLWLVLVVFLIVKGILLGIDIVKASDEAEVRRKKVSGLVWLFIGVFAALAITVGASIVMGFFGYGGYLL